MERIEKTPLCEKVRQKIIEYFKHENLTEGDMIPSENEFKELLGVSRVVVREALGKLREENIIVTYRGKGSFIANPKNFQSKILTDLSYERFVDIMKFRFVIECEAIKEAVAKRTEKELSSLISLADKMEKAEEKEGFCKSDFAFHLEIAKLSGNSLFVSAIENAGEDIMSCFSLMNGLDESRSWSVPLHKKLAKFISEKNSADAIKLLKTNGEYNFARMKNLFSGEGYEDN